MVAPLVFTVVLAVFAGLMLNKASSAELPPDTDTRPKVIAVFTMDDCSWCDVLKKRIAHRKWKTDVKETWEQPYVESFPTVFYEVPDANGKPTLVQDHGENIHKGNVRPPEAPVTIVHWRTK